MALRNSGVRGFDRERALRLEGDLTIRDVTGRCRSTSSTWVGATISGEASGSILRRTAVDRDDFGASWNMVLETGLLVGKRVLVGVEIEAVLRAAS
jgi:polyisoprenoid-binding protein YceI